MKSDREIWQEALDKEENIDLFKTIPGGLNIKPLPKRKLFKTQEEKNIDDRIKSLDEQVNKVTTEITKRKVIEDRLTRLEKTVESLITEIRRIGTVVNSKVR